MPRASARRISLGMYCVLRKPRGAHMRERKLIRHVPCVTRTAVSLCAAYYIHPYATRLRRATAPHVANVLHTQSAGAAQLLVQLAAAGAL